MKTYTPQVHLSILGILLLVAGSIVIGLAGGALAYLVSNFIYYLVIFAFFAGLLIAVVYHKWIHVTRVRSSILTAIFGAVTGLCIAYGFYSTPYWIERHQVIDEIKEEYQVDAKSASIGLDNYLYDETGSTGLIAYMKLRAKQGDKYTSTLVVNSAPVQTSSFTLKSTASWLYWLLEILGFTLPCTWFGFSAGKQPFCRGSNDWYETSRTQIGSARIEELEILKAYFGTNDLQSISQVLLPEGGLEHPMLEVYAQRCVKPDGEVLISLMKTQRKNEKSVKRATVGQWEMGLKEFGVLKEMMEGEEMKEKNQMKANISPRDIRI